MVSSNCTLFHKELSFLVNYFYNNGFPRHIVYREINRFLNKIMHPKPIYDTADKLKLFLSLPYFGHQSEKMKIEIEKIMAKYFPQINIRIVLSNKNTTGSFFRYKDVVPKMQRSSVIYKYCCGQCPSTCYVGSTTRPLYMRVAEHSGCSFYTGNRLASPKETAVLVHSTEFSHNVAEENFKIVGATNNEISLRILESLHIFREKPNLNKTVSSFPLRIV